MGALVNPRGHYSILFHRSLATNNKNVMWIKVVILTSLEVNSFLEVIFKWGRGHISNEIDLFHYGKDFRPIVYKYVHF